MSARLRLDTGSPGPSGPPVQVVTGPVHHGIAVYAAQLATELGATLVTGDVATVDALDPTTTPRVHLHVTDRLLGATPAESARRVERLCRRVPTTLTLHDVPQAWDSPERRQAYADMVRAAHGVAVNSHHEAALLAALLERLGAAPRGSVVLHLPLVPWSAPVDDTSWAGRGDLPTLAILGFVYPDKGHRELLHAAAKLRADDREVEVLCLGEPVAGHQDLVDELHERARAAGVRLRVTGHLSDAELHEAMAAVTVPVTGHRHLSASGSMNSWLAAGRRPLVLDGAYAREMAALRPGSYRVYEDDALADQVALALDDPALTRLTADAVVAPRLADTARGYAAWWASVHRTAPEARRPVAPPMPSPARPAPPLGAR